MPSKFDKVREFFNYPNNYLQRRSSINIRIAAVRKLLQDVPKTSILDFGCGDGSISLQFLNEKTHLTMVDFSEEMLQRCIDNTPRHLLSHIEFICSPLEDYVPQKKFDVVLCIGLLPHVEDLQRVLKKVDECMKPGGYCLLHIIDWDSLGGKIIFAAAALHEIMTRTYGYKLDKISSSMLMKMLSPRGIKLVQERRYWYHLPLMGKLFSDSFLEKYGLWTLRTRWLSVFGSDAILMFRKDQPKRVTTEGPLI
jgi:2-polyprenyl-3-methyl-5-hydroxy-6-metoxy-1,4-benzoquinol methylase